MQHKTIITDLVSLRGDVVDTEIVKQQRRSLWTEKQSLEARHVYQTGTISPNVSCLSMAKLDIFTKKYKTIKALTVQGYIWISYERGLVFVSIYRNRKRVMSRSYSMFLRRAQATGTHLAPSEFRTQQRNNIFRHTLNCHINRFHFLIDQTILP